MARILFFSESSEPGGAETVILRLVDHFRGGRWDATVLLMEEGWLADRLRELGVQPIVLTSSRSFDLRFVMQMSRLIRAHRIDLIHSHLPDSNAYASIAARFTGVPVIATCHGMMETFGPLTRRGRIKYWLVGRLATRIVAVSQSMRQELLARASHPADRTRCIYNGIDWNLLDEPAQSPARRDEWGIPAHARLIGMFGFVRPVKGHLFGIRALQNIRRTIPNAHLLIVGEEDSAYKRELDQEIDALGLSSNVTFLGFRSDVGRWLRMIDVFIMPSLSEGHPLAIIEAMGMGLPVVASRVGGLPEIVQEGETGYLVTAGDSDALAQRVIEMLSNDALSKAMASKAKHDVRQRYSIEQMFDQYAHLYEECLGTN